MGRLVRDDFESERQQGVTRENRGGVVEFFVNGRFAPPEVIVVHGR